jgi:SNF2 family DNA or RNA helicase
VIPAKEKSAPNNEPPTSPTKKFKLDAPVVVEPRRELKDVFLDERVFIPGSLASKLRDYQLDGVRFMYNRWKHGLGCILGDDMGLGKTVQVVSLLVALLEQKDERRTFLIIAPLTCLDQWSGELKKWGDIRTSTFHGSPLSKKAALADIVSGRVDILLTSYETFEHERAMLADKVRIIIHQSV